MTSLCVILFADVPIIIRQKVRLLSLGLLLVISSCKINGACLRITIPTGLCCLFEIIIIMPRKTIDLSRVTGYKFSNIHEATVY